MTYSFSDFSEVQEGDTPLEKGTYVVLTASSPAVPGSPAPLLSSSSTYIFFLLLFHLPGMFWNSEQNCVAYQGHRCSVCECWALAHRTLSSCVYGYHWPEETLE